MDCLQLADGCLWGIVQQSRRWFGRQPAWSVMFRIVRPRMYVHTRSALEGRGYSLPQELRQ
jgi:hypothetical protein